MLRNLKFRDSALKEGNRLRFKKKKKKHKHKKNNGKQTFSFSSIKDSEQHNRNDMSYREEKRIPVNRNERISSQDALQWRRLEIKACK